MKIIGALFSTTSRLRRLIRSIESYSYLR